MNLDAEPTGETTDIPTPEPTVAPAEVPVTDSSTTPVEEPTPEPVVNSTESPSPEPTAMTESSGEQVAEESAMPTTTPSATPSASPSPTATPTATIAPRRSARLLTQSASYVIQVNDASAALSNNDFSGAVSVEYGTTPTFALDGYSDDEESVTYYYLDGNTSAPITEEAS